MAENPGKQYVLLSAATALQQMRVSGLPPQTCGCAFMFALMHHESPCHASAHRLEMHLVAANLFEKIQAHLPQCPAPDG